MSFDTEAIKKKRRLVSSSTVDDGISERLSSILDNLSLTNDSSYLYDFFQSGKTQLFLQSWAYASQVSDYQALSSRSKLLVKLIEVSSRIPALNDGTVELCSKIIDQELKVVYRCLYLSRPAVTIPVLRLLTVIAQAYDGRFVNDLVSNFDFTIKAIPKLLSVTKSQEPNSIQPGIREHVIRFILAILKHGSFAVKKELLAQKTLLRAWFKLIPVDNARLVRYTVSTFDSSVLEDKNFSKLDKLQLFNTSVLSKLSELLLRSDTFEETGSTEDESSTNASKRTIKQLVFDFMVKITCSTTYGIKFNDSTWFNAVLPADELKNRSHSSFPEQNRVKNKSLLTFLTTLKPHTDPIFRELSVTILYNSQELIPVFMNSFSFSLEPKLTSFWVSYIYFLHEILCFPIPQNVSDSTSHEAPPIDNVIENLLPKPLSSSVLTKMLNHPSIMVKHLAFQLSIVALDKLKSVQDVFTANNWAEMLSKVNEKIFLRLPDMQTYFSSMASVPEKYKLIRLEALSCILAYAKCFPRALLNGKYQLPKEYTNSVGNWDSFSSVDFALLSQTLEAQMSLSALGRWWNPGNDSNSTFTSLIQLACKTDEQSVINQTRRLLANLLESTAALSIDSRDIGEVRRAVFALIYACRTCVPAFSDTVKSSLWHLLDESISRCVRTPFKYVDVITSIRSTGIDKETTRSVSPLIVVLFDQVKFLDSTVKSTIIREFLVPLTYHLAILGQDLFALTDLARKYEIDIPMTDLASIVNWFKTGEQKLDTSYSSYGKLLTWSSKNILDALAEGHAISEVELYTLAIRLQLWAYGKTDDDDRDDDFLKILSELISYTARFPDLLETFTSRSYWSLLFPEDMLRVGRNSHLIASVLARVIVSANEKSRQEFSLYATNFTRKALQALKYDKADSLASSQLKFLAELLFTVDSEVILEIVETVLLTDSCPPYLQIAVFDASVRRKIALPSSVLTGVTCSTNLDSIQETLVKAFDNNLFTTEKENESTLISFIGHLMNEYKEKRYKLLSTIIRSYPIQFRCASESFTSLESMSDDLVIAITSDPNICEDAEKNENLLRYALSRCLARLSTDVKGADTSYADGVLRSLNNLKTFTTQQELQFVILEITRFNDNRAISESVCSIINFALSSECDDETFKSIKGWAQKTFIWLTSWIAQDKPLSESIEKLLEGLGKIFTNPSVLASKMLHKNQVNSFLEICLSKYIQNYSLMRLCLLIANRHDTQTLEYTKMIQIILNNPNNPLVAAPMDRSLASLFLVLALLVYVLFSKDVKGNSNWSVQVGVRNMFNAGNTPHDAILMYILEQLEARTLISWTADIELWRFSSFTAQSDSDDNQKLEDDYKTDGKLIERHGDSFVANIDTQKIYDSIRNFCPVSLRMKRTIRDFKAGVNLSQFLSDMEKYYVPINWSTYDYSFIIGSLTSSDLVTIHSSTDDDGTKRDEVKLHARGLLESYGLSFVITSLSSWDNKLNSLANECIVAFVSALKNDQTRDRAVMRVFLSKILATLSKMERPLKSNAENNRLPCCVAIILANMVNVLDDPSHIMYDFVSNYVFAGPLIKWYEVPMFKVITHECFDRDGRVRSGLYHHELYSKQLNWYFEVLVMGMKTGEDFKLYKNQGIIDLLMTFSISSTCNANLKNKIWQLLFAVQKTLGANSNVSLIKSQGFLTGLSQRIDILKSIQAKLTENLTGETEINQKSDLAADLLLHKTAMARLLDSTCILEAYSNVNQWTSSDFLPLVKTNL